VGADIDGDVVGYQETGMSGTDGSGYVGDAVNIFKVFFNLHNLLLGFPDVNVFPVLDFNHKLRTGGWWEKQIFHVAESEYG